jgi:hypothetical protein
MVPPYFFPRMENTHTLTTGTGNLSAVRLKYGQAVRGNTFPRWTQRIGVYSVRGYAASYGESGEEAIERAKRNGHELAFTVQDPTVISNDYAGKAEKLAALEAEIESAPVLCEGDLVEIEGLLYKSRLIGADYSSPIKFEQLPA